MVNEFNLSKRICKAHCENEVMLEVDDVKNFIKHIKRRLSNFYGESGGGWNEVIDKLAGDKLT